MSDREIERDREMERVREKGYLAIYVIVALFSVRSIHGSSVGPEHPDFTEIGRLGLTHVCRLLWVEFGKCRDGPFLLVVGDDAFKYIFIVSSNFANRLKGRLTKMAILEPIPRPNDMILLFIQEHNLWSKKEPNSEW